MCEAQKLKVCPFCKGEAELIKEPLWNGGHGYFDCYEFYVKCSNLNCFVKPKSKSYHTIYEKNYQIQISKAVNAWNDRNIKVSQK